MGVFEIVSAIVLIVACVFIVVVILVKDTKTHMSQTISGTSSDSFYQRNAGRTKEAMLNKATIAAAIIFFALAIAVNVINVYGKEAEAGGTSSPTVSATESNTSSETSDTSDTSDTSATASDTSETSETSNTSDTSDNTESGTASE